MDNLMPGTFWTVADEIEFDQYSEVMICPVTLNDQDCGCDGDSCQGKPQDATECPICKACYSDGYIQEHYRDCYDNWEDDYQCY